MYRRRMILSLLTTAFLIPAAWAARAMAAEHGEPEKAGPAYVDIATVGLPIVSNGRLVNYVFTQVRLNVAPGSDASALRLKEPYFRDALVRAAHRSSLAQAGSLTRLDEAAMKRVMLAEAAKIAGPRAIASVQILNQTPQRTRFRG